MKGYIIGDHRDIADTGKFSEYVARLHGLISAWGGKFLVKAGDGKPVEGEWKPGRICLIEFPSPEIASAFYNSTEYQAITPLRLDSSTSSHIVVTGAP